jgi:hypothetical protein
MGSRSKFIKHLFAGGWATDYGPTAFVGVTAGNKVSIPWLNEAENVTYELDGGPHKVPGIAKNNTAALESGATIAGVFDAWFSGTSGTPTQHRIMHIGTKIKKDNANNTFTDLFTGMTAGAVPCYTMLEDLLIMSNDSGVDVPKSWDGTTAQNLAGTPPTFSFSCEHLNYVFAAGDKANPSRLYYCVAFTPNDWVGSGSGHIDLSPSDGDAITGIISFRDQLFVFKGPHKGSIHRISGSAPTGDDPFARSTFVKGMGAVNHNSLVSYQNDVGFMWSDGTVRSLSATQQYGDYNESTASEPINTWIRDHVNRSQLRKAYAVNWPEYGIVLYALPVDGSAVNNIVIMMDYRFSPPRWAKWSSYNMITSLAQAVDESGGSSMRTVIAGCRDGFMRTLGNTSRTLDGTASIPYNVLTPYLDYDLPDQMKTLEGASICFNPKNAGNVVLGWSADGHVPKQDTISQGGGGQAFLDSFVLDSDILGGAKFYEGFSRLAEQGGEFGSIQYQLLNNGADEDVEIHSLSVSLTPAAANWAPR